MGPASVPVQNEQHGQCLLAPPAFARASSSGVGNRMPRDRQHATAESQSMAHSVLCQQIPPKRESQCRVDQPGPSGQQWPKTTNNPTLKIAAVVFLPTCRSTARLS